MSAKQTKHWFLGAQILELILTAIGVVTLAFIAWTLSGAYRVRIGFAGEQMVANQAWDYRLWALIPQLMVALAAFTFAALLRLLRSIAIGVQSNRTAAASA